MAIDPALIGTTFGAALEAAERDENAKRAARAAEMAVLKPIVPVVTLIEELPEDVDYISILTPTQISILEAGIANERFPLTRAQANQNSQRLAEWGMINPIHRGVYEITDFGISAFTCWHERQIVEDTDMTSEYDFTPTQISILESGIESDHFKLTRKQAGKSSGQMSKWKLIEPSKTKGHWMLTDKGRDEYERIKTLEAAKNDITMQPSESTINLDDPALKPAIETLDVSPEAIKGVITQNEQLRKKITNLEKSLDDMGKVADDLQARLTAATQGGKPMSDPDRVYYEQLLGQYRTIHQWMEEDGLSQELVEYVTELRGRIVIDSGIVNDINNMAALHGKGNMDPRDYVKWLRESLTNLEAQKEYVPFEFMQEDGLTHLDTASYVKTLRERLEAFKGVDVQSQRMFIAALAAMRDEDGSERPFLDYIEDLRKKARLVDDYAGRIESLTRCVDDLQENLKARLITPARAADAMLAAKILDELCEMLPEIEDYRTAREKAVKAISSLTAKRP